MLASSSKEHPLESHALKGAPNVTVSGKNNRNRADRKNHGRVPISSINASHLDNINNPTAHSSAIFGFNFEI